MTTARWKTSPAGVRLMARLLRSNSRTPIFRSMSAMARLTAGCEVWSSAAVALKLRFRAALSKMRRVRIGGNRYWNGVDISELVSISGDIGISQIATLPIQIQLIPVAIKLI